MLLEVAAEMSAPLVVLVVGAYPLIRFGVRDALRETGRNVLLLEAATPDEGMRLLGERADVDLLFLDSDLAPGDAPRLVSRLRACAPTTPLIVFTTHEDAALLKNALAAGAAGVIPKTHSKRLMLKAVDLVMEGGVYIPPDLTRELATPARAAPRRAALGGERVAMSERQRRIVELMAQGLPNKEIARRLGLAASTVKNQLTVVFGRLQVSNRTQAAIAVRALGQVHKY